MVRKMACLIVALLLAVSLSACAENEYKVKEKKEVQKESTPTDVSPGEMVVE
jgi:uncharacterized lipoprotein YehR (DUF1307 family)